ncbi:hypothetical protein GW17_00008920 [Ensete ventricosum]|nr:hypothetical protein GW17_00008920 [Ensete ventricosum]
MYEQDPDLVRWGLHLLLEPPSNSGYCATSSHNSTNDSRLHCADESGSSEARDSVENDEVIAHALQEQLSQIAIAEASGPSLVTEEQLQESVLTQNWLASSTTSENISGIQLATSLFKHVPRINKEVPSVDEEISDHQRLLERLRLYDLVDLKVQGDGNCQHEILYFPPICRSSFVVYSEIGVTILIRLLMFPYLISFQFRALSDQLYRSPEHHKFVRQQVVDQVGIGI